MDIITVSRIIIKFIPILLFIVGVIKFLKSKKFLKEDSENCKYKKALLISKELVITSIVLAVIWFYYSVLNGFTYGLDDLTDSDIMRHRLSLLITAYIVSLVALVVIYFIILAIVKNNIKNSNTDKMYVDCLEKHKNVVHKVFLITFILYFCIVLILFKEYNSIPIDIVKELAD